MRASLTRDSVGAKQGRKILFLSQYFHPEQFLNNHVARALAQAGHRVDVVCCVPNYPEGRFFAGYSNRRQTKETWDGVVVHRVFTIPRGRSAAQLVANYLAYPVAASLEVIKLARRRAFDVSFVSMPSPLLQAFAGIFAKKVFRVPTIYWVQDIWPESAIITLGIRNRLAVNVLNAVCGWIYRQADLVMVQSGGFHAKIAAHGVDPAHIVTLPNSAPAHFRPISRDAVPRRIQALVPQDRRVVMFAGNIGESQDFDTIIDAAALVPASSKLLIVVVGSGRDEARVQARVRNAELSDRFLFLGRHAEADMPAFFACADVMLASLKDEPIFALTVPSKVQCYMACGKPILANLAGEGARIISEAGAGVAVAPGSPRMLASALEELAQASEVELAAMGRRALASYRDRFSLEAVVTTLDTHIRAVTPKLKLCRGKIENPAI